MRPNSRRDPEFHLNFWDSDGAPEGALQYTG
jgi:hypothetical protein